MRGIRWLRGYANAAWLGLATIGAYGLAMYSFGALLTPIREETGWSTGGISGAYSLGVLLAGGVALATGRTLDRVGPRPVLTTGLAVGSALLVLASFARSQTEFVATWALGAGVAGGCLFYNVTMPLTARLFPEHRATAFSVLTFLGALAGPLFYPLSSALTEWLGWRAGLRALVAIMLMCVLPAALLVARPAPSAPSTVDGASTERVDRGGTTTVVAALRTPRVVLTIAMIALAGMAASALVVHQVPAMQASGLGLAAASGYAGLRGFFQIPGRIVLTPLTNALGVAGATALAYGLGAIGIGALIIGGSPALVLLFIVATGLSIGAWAPLHGLIAAEVYSERLMGTLTGVQQAIASLAGAAGPWLAGLALDATGGYRAPLLGALAVQLGALALLGMQRRADRREVTAAVQPAEGWNH